KMLYDNAQLIALYAKAFQLTNHPFFKLIVDECIQFINSELSNNKGGYYSSLDADSEGEEGKYYVWNFADVKAILKEDLELFTKVYDITEQGNWEQTNILKINDNISPDQYIDQYDSILACRKKL